MYFTNKLQILSVPISRKGEKKEMALTETNTEIAKHITILLFSRPNNIFQYLTNTSNKNTKNKNQFNTLHLTDCSKRALLF